MVDVHGSSTTPTNVLVGMCAVCRVCDVWYFCHCGACGDRHAWALCATCCHRRFAKLLAATERVNPWVLFRGGLFYGCRKTFDGVLKGPQIHRTRLEELPSVYHGRGRGQCVAAVSYTRCSEYSRDGSVAYTWCFVMDHSPSTNGVHGEVHMCQAVAVDDGSMM